MSYIILAGDDGWVAWVGLGLAVGSYLTQLYLRHKDKGLSVHLRTLQTSEQVSENAYAQYLYIKLEMGDRSAMVDKIQFVAREPWSKNRRILVHSLQEIEEREITKEGPLKVMVESLLLVNATRVKCEVYYNGRICPVSSKWVTAESLVRADGVFLHDTVISADSDFVPPF